MTKLFTVCCLFYGNHPDLVERLMKSLARPEWAGKFDLRIGANAISAASEKVLKYYLDTPALDAALAELFRGHSAPYDKYPMMRRLFYRLPIATPYMLWFDDDSHILRSAPPDWFDTVEERLQTCDIAGAPYFKHPEGGQQAFWESQSWYTGRPWKERRGRVVVDFITGGWWASGVSMLREFDYPIQMLAHNGGDVLLGAMMYQQRKKLGMFTSHVGINCDKSNRCSSAPRRGMSQKPLGYDYKTDYVPEQPTPIIRPAPTPPDWHTLLG